MATFDNSIENLGAPMSHYAYGMGWGSACSGPLDLFKAAVGEGGIRSPLIIAGPGVKGNRKIEAFSYVTDIMPTILEMANLNKPDEFNGHKVEKMMGRSITKVLSGEADKVYADSDIIAGEMANGKWARLGDFKASFVPKPYGEAKWKLYNLKNDPGETTDISVEKPELLKKIVDGWKQYADEVGVLNNDYTF
jgi:arylsulfatase A-like enzyme